MIILHKPELEVKGDKAFISACYTSVRSGQQRLWFSVPDTYQNYLTVETLDAFVVGLLLLAMKNGEDIQVKAPMSEKLFYQLSHYLIPALDLAIPELKPIRIEITQGLVSQNFNEAGVAGTGMSLGIDSICTLVEHLDCEKGYRVDYFTFCNVGSSHLPSEPDISKNTELFVQRLALVESFADEVGIPIISMDSNLHQLFPIPYFRTHTIRTAAFALILQKLFSSYHYSSAYRFDYFKLDPHDTSKYDLLLLPMLSTESMDFYSSASRYTRVERTKLVSDFAPSYRHLNVCASPGASWRLGGKNCSVCGKCLRTQLTLDLLGKLHFYGDVFDHTKYLKKKAEFIGYCLYYQRSKPLLREIVSLMKDKKMKMPLTSYLYYFLFAFLQVIPDGLERSLRRVRRKILEFVS